MGVLSETLQNVMDFLESVFIGIKYFEQYKWDIRREGVNRPICARKKGRVARTACFLLDRRLSTRYILQLK